MNKIISTISLILWSIIVILVLSFGTKISSKIFASLYEKYTYYSSRVDITNFELEKQDFYLINKNYTLKYQIETNKDKEVKLIFESLNPDVFEVTKTGVIKGLDFEGNVQTGYLRVTSTNDEDFTKDIELTFKKVYPDSISAVNVRTALYKLTSNVYVDSYFYAYPSFKSENGYTEKDFEYIYDPEYFEHIEGYLFYAKKTGKNIEMTISMDNGRLTKTRKINILENKTTVEQLDKIEFYESSKLVDLNLPTLPNKIYYMRFVTNEKDVHMPYTVTSSDDKIVTIDKYGRISTKKAGDATITITLQNGTTYHQDIKVRNTLTLPTFSEIPYNDSNIIEIKYMDKIEFKYTFPEEAKFKSMKFEYDKKALTITTKNGSIFLTGKQKGDTSFKVYLDDGIDYIEEEFLVTVVDNPDYSKPKRQDLQTIFNKIFGHMGLFCVEAIFALWFVTSFKFKHHYTEGIIYVGIGVTIACITEFIQRFLPGRNPTMKDVAIDMLGYTIGFVFIFSILLIIKLISWIKNHHDPDELTIHSASKE